MQRRMVKILTVCLVFSVLYVGLYATKIYFVEKELIQLENKQQELAKKKDEYLEKKEKKLEFEEELSRMENGMILPNIIASANGKTQIESILFHIREAVPMTSKLYDAEYKSGAIRVRGVARDVHSIAQMASSFSKEYQVYIGNVQEITHNEEGYIPFSILLSIDKAKTRDDIEVLFKDSSDGEMPPFDGEEEEQVDGGEEAKEEQEVE